MKKHIAILLILFLPWVLNAQVSKNNLSGKLGISLYAGANIPVNGNISSNVKTTDYLYTGPHYGFGASYYFNKSIGIEVTALFSLNLNQKFYEWYNKSSGIYSYAFSLNGIYNFAHLLKSKIISPYVKGGIGVYTWKYLDDAPWNGGGVIIKDGVEYKATNFGFNVSAGADYLLSKQFSIGLLIDYNMYFPKDEAKFGKDFGGQGSLTPQLKLCYYLPFNK